MMLSLFATAVMAVGITASPADSGRYTRQDLARELPSVLRIDSTRYGFSVDLDTTRATGPLGTRARANGHFVLYVVQNALGKEARVRIFSGKTQDVRRRLLAELTADSASVRILTESAGRYQSITATQGTAGRPLAAPVQAVTFRRAMDIAARFFYPDAVLPNGTIQSHVCVGINGVADMQGGRDLALEGFVYAAIFHDLLKPKFYVTADFDAASRLINAMDLSAEPATRLQRAQGVMWGAMMQSERLRQVVAVEYRQAQSYLPFRIVDAPSGGLDAVRR
jgi:hypothetical protein